MNSTVMGVKHFEVVKQRSHADKQWSPDKIRVCHLRLKKVPHPQGGTQLAIAPNLPKWYLPEAIHPIAQVPLVWVVKT